MIVYMLAEGVFSSHHDRNLSRVHTLQQSSCPSMTDDYSRFMDSFAEIVEGEESLVCTRWRIGARSGLHEDWFTCELVSHVVDRAE